MCAGGEEGLDACEGDGGAPLVCEGASGRWYVVGLVSWGEGCGTPGVPSVYARVSYFSDFIDDDPTLTDEYYENWNRGKDPRAQIPVGAYRPAGYRPYTGRG